MSFQTGSMKFCCEAGAQAYPSDCPHHGPQERIPNVTDELKPLSPNHPAMGNLSQEEFDESGYDGPMIPGASNPGDINFPPDQDEPSTEVSNWVDKAMFEAEGFDKAALEAPQVYLLSATPDPLGAVAAMSMMYEGRVIRDLREITDDERRHYFDECFKTTLKAPLEAIDFHFMVEGVTRAHSHQEVRQRTAVFAQESMRFAVKDKIVARPGPMIGGQKRLRVEWESAMEELWDTYKWLIANGVPAEEARGILPHDTLTRLHHKVNLRNLMDELGKRLCTQAQFEWRAWAGSVREAIRSHIAFVPDPASVRVERKKMDAISGMTLQHRPDDAFGRSTGWQFRYIAESPLFVPICFNTGRCMFKAEMDRGCTIRERVEAGKFEEIKTEEWASDPKAGWTR